MSAEITESVLQAVSGTLEKVLLEERQGSSFAMKKMEGIKINIGVHLDVTGDGIMTNYTVGYPLEPKPEPSQKQKITKREILNG